MRFMSIPLALMTHLFLAYFELVLLFAYDAQSARVPCRTADAVFKPEPQPFSTILCIRLCKSTDGYFYF